MGSGGGHGAGDGGAPPDTPPLFSIFKEPNKTEPKHRAQRPKRTPRHAMRASAVANIYIYIEREREKVIRYRHITYICIKTNNNIDTQIYNICRYMHLSLSLYIYIYLHLYVSKSRTTTEHKSREASAMTWRPAVPRYRLKK